MRAARALQRMNLLMHLQRAGNDDDGHEGQEPSLNPGRKLEISSPWESTWSRMSKFGGSLAMTARACVAVQDAGHFVFGQRPLVDFVLEVVIFIRQ